MSVFSEKKGMIFLLLTVFIATGCDLIAPTPKKTKYQTQPKETVVSEEKQSIETAPAATKTIATALPKDVLAKVGDWTLTTSEFDERIKGIKQVVKDFDENNIDSKKMVLEELIRQQLLVREAREEKIDQQKDVRAAVEDFENTLLVQDLVAKLTENIKATEQDAKEYYDANPDQFIKGVEKQVREIVVATENEAKDILVQSLQGADFAQMAKDRSKAKSAANGGDLGFVYRAPFEQMQKTLDTVNKGGVSSVFQGPEGYYIVKVEDVRGGDKATFDEVKEELVKGLTIQKQQKAVLDKLAETSKKVDVQINADLFNTKTGE